MLIVNNWYAAGWADEITSAPLRVRMLGMDFVLFRDATERIVCLSDVCCHRGASLADGIVRDGRVICPYHGWEFDGGGACRKIPSIGAEGTIPQRARVDAYPVTELYGLVFAFLGDRPASERPTLPDLLPEFDGEKDRWRFSRITYDWDCNWVRLGENSVDTAHPSFVHRRFGSRLDPVAQIVPIEDRPGFGARIVRTRAAPAAEQKTSSVAQLLPRDRKQTRVELEFTIVGLLEKLRQDMHTGVTQLLWTARTPIDLHRTRSFNLQGRNFLMEPEHDAERVALFAEAAEEDHRIVRRVKPTLTPRSLRNEVIVEPDGMEIAFRRRAMQAARELGEIDLARVAIEGEHNVFVVPSPARAEQSAAWAHRRVPLVIQGALGGDADERIAARGP